MPIFEYKCNDCGSRYEILHKSLNNLSEIECPSCGSQQSTKLLSAFNASVSNSESANTCSGGSCGLPAGGCSGGLCGLN